LEQFLRVLTANRTLLPELFVQPESLESDGPVGTAALADRQDPRLRLFFGEPLCAEAFQKGCAGSARFRPWLRTQMQPRLTPDLRRSSRKVYVSVLGATVHVRKRSNSSLWQCSSYFARKNRRTSTKQESLSKSKEIGERYLQLRENFGLSRSKMKRTFREMSERRWR
jgi:hypothetical protein